MSVRALLAHAQSQMFQTVENETGQKPGAYQVKVPGSMKTRTL